MRCIRAQCRAACIPAKMVQLVAHIRQIEASHDLAIRFRGWVNIHNQERIRLLLAIGVERGHKSHLLLWRLNGESRRGIKSWVSFEEGHSVQPLTRISLCFLLRKQKNLRV